MRKLTGVVTKGLLQGNDIETDVPESFVERYKVVYSRDGVSWNSVLDDFEHEKVAFRFYDILEVLLAGFIILNSIRQIFVGNYDGDTSVANYFKRPIHARYLKVLPVKWQNAIALRLDVLGCFEPYEEVRTVTEPPTSKCNNCHGILNDDLCKCTGDLWWDGVNCVSHSECPCVVGHLA